MDNILGHSVDKQWLQPHDNTDLVEEPVDTLLLKQVWKLAQSELLPA